MSRERCFRRRREAPRLPRRAGDRRDQLLWLVLSAMGSVMLLAVTNHITQNIASVPFLWVLPLALYLITFILAFDHPRWYVRPLFIVALLALLAGDGVVRPVARPAHRGAAVPGRACSSPACSATASSRASSPIRRT